VHTSGKNRDNEIRMKLTPRIAWEMFEGFRSPHTDVPHASWDNITQWQHELESTLRTRRADLVKYRTDWDLALADLDLRDPSAVDRTSLRVLRLSREEDWSDWLAQLLEDSRGDFTRRLLREPPSVPVIVRRVSRELSSHEGWRADVIIEWQDQSYTHLEVKIGDSNLDKTLDTAEAMERRFEGQRCRGDFILLLPDQRDYWGQRCFDNERLGARVKAITWVDVSRALRASLRAGSESPVWRVWAHALCGAIEQKLLRIPGGGEPEIWVRRLRLRELVAAHDLLRLDEAHDD